MKTFLSSIVAAAIFLGVLGCGKSEATKAAEQQATERHDAQQKFKEAIAALKVCTDGATYDEFRQAEMNSRTSFEVNKSYLENILEDFNKLNVIMSACDYCWVQKNQSEDSAPIGLYKPTLMQIEILNPNITNKVDFDTDKLIDDPDKLRVVADKMRNDQDFQAGHNVRLGLTQIKELCGEILGKLN